jgi:hypothetical protein
MLRPVSRPLTTIENGRFVSYGPDVLEMKRRIEERWPELECVFDQVDLEWTILEHTKEHGTKLALGQTFKARDDRVYRRLERADGYSPIATDPLEAIDAYNAGIEREQDRKIEDICGDTAERLTFALKKDGFFDHENIYGPKPRRGARFAGAVRSTERVPD